MQFVTINYKKNIQGFVIIQTVYAFIMALGLREIFLSFPSLMETLALTEARISWVALLVIMLSLLAVLLVGIRFFWVPRNLREIVTVYAKTQTHLETDGHTGSPETSIQGIVFPAHIIIILVHAAIFYFLCVEFRRVIDVYNAKEFIQFVDFNVLFFMFIVLLFWNGIWLAFIQAQINGRYHSVGLTPPAGLRAMSIWWKNNVIAGALALSFFALISTCGISTQSCLASNPDFARLGWTFVPGGPQQIAGSVELLLGRGDAFTADLAAALIIVCVFLLNSIFDLAKTGAAYMIFEDVEWTQQAQSQVAAESLTREQAGPPSDPPQPS